MQVQWSYQDNENQWNEYDYHSNNVVEQCYQDYLRWLRDINYYSNVLKISMTLTPYKDKLKIKGYEYRINFGSGTKDDKKDYTQTNVITGKVRKIIRSK